MAQLSFWEYIKAAFNAKPKGLFVAPNWIGLGVCGLLGFLNPGIWFIGAGLELGYLLACANSRRFRKAIAAGSEQAQVDQQQNTVREILKSLPAADQKRYLTLGRQCEAILKSQRQTSEDATVTEQERSLAHLVWIYLNLLKTRDVLDNHLQSVESEQAQEGSLEMRLAEMDAQLLDPALGSDLKRSLTSRHAILTERLQKRTETTQKLDFTEAELQRIADQVQLLRDQTALQTDPAQLTTSLDRISGEMKEASTWIREQRNIYRELGDTLDDPAPSAIFLQE